MTACNADTWIKRDALVPEILERVMRHAEIDRETQGAGSTLLESAAATK